MSHQTIGNLAADTRINIEESVNQIVENVDAVLFILPEIETPELWKTKVNQEFSLVRKELESVIDNIQTLDKYFMDFLNFEDTILARDLSQLSLQINTDLREALTRLTYLVDALGVLPEEEESILLLVVKNASNKILVAEERFNQALSDMSNLVAEFFKLTQPDGVDQESDYLI